MPTLTWAPRARRDIVAYRVLEDGVDILAVVHHARDVRRVLRDL